MARRVSVALQDSIKAILRDTIGMDDPDRRKHFARNAGFPESLLNKINWSALTDSFIDDFVFQCNGWGSFSKSDPRLPLVEYLKVLKYNGGAEHNIAIDKVLVELGKELGLNDGEKEPPEIVFVNREEEIRYLKNPNSTITRFAIHAPAGFGKTWLLLQLQQEFQRMEWIASYATWTSDTSLLDFSSQLLLSINNDELSNCHIDDVELPRQFASILKREWRSKGENTRAGIVLLIDCGNHPILDHQSFATLLNVWLDQVTQEIEGLKIFSPENYLFKVFIAGRFFDDTIQLSLKNCQFMILPLEPFEKEEALEQSVKRYLTDIKSEWQIELWTNLYFFTGGHPGLISKILKEYWEQDKPTPKYFFEKRSIEIQKMVLEEVDKILFDFPAETKQLLLSVSPFRCMSHEVLEDIQEQPEKFLEWNKDVYRLADHLTYTQLVQVDDVGILRDSISRRIMTLYLRFNNPNPEDYQKRCRQANKIYEKRLKDKDDPIPPHFWAVEYLYSYLHASLQNNNSINDRRSLRYSFWGNDDDDFLSQDSVLFSCLQLLTERQDPRRILRPLQGSLNKDWDFQFTINFFLREQHYEPKWFSTLISKIQSYLTNSISFGK